VWLTSHAMILCLIWVLALPNIVCRFPYNEKAVRISGLNPCYFVSVGSASSVVFRDRPVKT
jgi:hypothetical protein